MQNVKMDPFVSSQNKFSACWTFSTVHYTIPIKQYFVVVDTAINSMVHRKYPTLAALIPSAVGVDMSFLSTVTGVALSIEDADDSSDDDAESTSTNEGDSDVSSDADSTCDEQEQAQQLPNMIPIVPVPVRHRRRTFARKPMNQSTFWTSILSPEMKAVYSTDPDGRESS